MASVAKLEVPSNELMVVINGRRRVFPSVDVPWLLGSMTLLVDFVLSEGRRVGRPNRCLAQMVEASANRANSTREFLNHENLEVLML
jgi:hypothetical protein